jgi:hypothetical protein
MRVFYAENKRILKTEDSLTERSGFEPSVPLTQRDLRQTEDGQPAPRRFWNKLPELLQD